VTRAEIAVLALKAASEFFATHTHHVRRAIRGELAALLPAAVDLLEPAEQGELAGLARASPRKPAPPRMVELLRRALGMQGMGAWADSQVPPVAPQTSSERVREWLALVTGPEHDGLLDAAIHFSAKRETVSDLDVLKGSFEQFLKKVKEKNMATYILDPRGIPAGFNAAAYRTALMLVLTGSFGMPDDAANADTIAAIEGALLLGEHFDPNAFDFQSAVEDAWKISLGNTKLIVNNVGDPPTQPNRLTYTQVANAITTLPGRNNSVAFQELASVAQYVIDNAALVPMNHPNFTTQVRIGLDKYVENVPPSNSFLLEPLTGDGASDVEVEPPNVEAVGLIYTALQLEKMQFFHVVDRVTELFMQGMLPISFDLSGKALNDYYWNSMFRMNVSMRNMVYGRVLGNPGSDVSKEVQPNREFNNLFLRFVASLSEYDRQRRLGDIFNNQRPSLSTTGEQVRKAGRDLAANVSLYGWAGTQAAAHRLKDHIKTAFGILRMPQIQKAYGVSNPYQVIERVSANEFGQAPNIVKYRTMAEAGTALLNLISKYAGVWSTNSSQSLFPEPDPQLTARFTSSDIPPADRDQFLFQATNWLAVQGVGSDQVGKMSEPSDTMYSPSLPAFGAVSTKNGAGGGSPDVMDKLRQMVQSGNAPSIDQLKDMIPAFKA